MTGQSGGELNGDADSPPKTPKYAPARTTGLPLSLAAAPSEPLNRTLPYALDGRQEGTGKVSISEAPKMSILERKKL